MANKIFVSYKYADSNVYPLELDPNTTVRSYVDVFEKEYLGDSDHIYKGESDGEDLSSLSEGTIWEKLKARIYDSSVTIVFLSKGMRNVSQDDKAQWIPWEAAYSLRETPRNDRTSHSNAVFAVALPDKRGSYDYYLEEKHCCATSCRMLKIGTLFGILRENMFNKSECAKADCEKGITLYYGESSYILSVKWSEFIVNPQHYIDRANAIKEHISDYNVQKTV